MLDINYNKIGIRRFGSEDYFPETWPHPIVVNGKDFSPILFLFDYIIESLRVEFEADPVAKCFGLTDTDLGHWFHLEFFSFLNRPKSIENFLLVPRVHLGLAGVLSQAYSTVLEELEACIDSPDPTQAVKVLISELYDLLSFVENNSILYWGVKTKTEPDSKYEEGLRSIPGSRAIEEYWSLPHFKSMRFNLEIIQKSTRRHLRRCEASFNKESKWRRRRGCSGPEKLDRGLS